ncbi:CYTH and CHAD domain-containing protein, partial [Frankia sp. ACN1ag]
TAPRTVTLDAVYYDSDDLRLARNQITLRRRTGGHDAGWHLKLPVRSDERLEVQRPLNDSAVPPGDLADLVLIHVRPSDLRPIAKITTERTVWRLRDAGGRDLVEIADDQVHSATFGSTTELQAWREIETELIGDTDPKILDLAGRTLIEAGAAPAGDASKLARVLGTSPRPTSTDRGRTRLRGRSPAGAVIRAYLVSQVDALVEADPRVRLDEPDSVHRMRVACRRLRSTLRTFAPLFDPDVAEDLAGRLRDLASALSGSRDREVMLEHLTAELAALPADLVVGPVAEHIAGQLTADLARSREETLAALRAESYLRLVTDLRAFVTTPYEGAAARPARDVLLPLAHRAGHKLARRVTAIEATPPGPARDLLYHQARKQAKQVRYAAEALVPLYGTDALAVAAFAEQAQNLLGDHQDAIVATGL